MELTQKFKAKSHELIVTLTFSLHSWVMGSAHHLTEINI